MSILLSIIIFCVVFFLYLHIYHHFKLSNDLEIYTIDGISKDKLEEICNLRQPVLFKFHNENLKDLTLTHLTQNYGSFDVKIKNNRKLEDISLPISIGNAHTLFQKDIESKYFTDKNEDFLQETGIRKILTQNDMFLRPALVSNCYYDLQTGSTNCWTPLQYSLNYRNYIYVSEGTITIKLIPPIYSKYLYEEKDYNSFEFRSPIHPWNIQDKYLRNFSKIKFLELDIRAGDMIYVPAYWWYSVRFKTQSAILCFKYCTYMNIVAILPHIFLSMLQKQNTKFDIVDKIS